MSLKIPVIPDEDVKPRSEKMEVEDVDSDSDSYSDSDSDGSEEKVIHCEVCMKDGVHMSRDCPYLVIIREPKDTPIGKDYMIVCHCCSLRDHGHPDGTWLGCAVINFYEGTSIFRKPGVIYHKPDGDDEDDILD
ncbi:hypothetical protein ACLB2K_042576 [Fragaria x ananassa]